MDWISIKDKEPRKGKRVLLYFPPTFGRNALAEWVSVERWPCSYPRRPTHWLPLPEPPALRGDGGVMSFVDTANHCDGCKTRDALLDVATSKLERTEHEFEVKYRQWIDAMCKRDDELDRLKTALKRIMATYEGLLEHPEIHINYQIARDALRGEGEK